LEVREMMSVTAGPVSFSVSHDQPLQVSTGGLLADSSTDSGDSLSAILVSNPADGTLSNFGSDGSFTFTPNAGFVGTDSFVFEATDGVDVSSPVAATVNVTDNPAQIQASDCADLAGDTLPVPIASFIDADDPNAVFTTSVNYGDGQTVTGTLAADGQSGIVFAHGHTYTTPGTYDGSVTITDPLGVSASASFTVTVLSQ
jgi:hypothetical protein